MADATSPPPVTSRNITAIALAVEGGLALVAVALGWVLHSPPLPLLRFDWTGLALGLAATLPMVAMLWAIISFPVGPLGNLVRVVDELIVPLFGGSSLAAILAIGLTAGLGEEMLFRGVVQGALASWLSEPHNQWIALAAASVLFGVLHWITPTYAVWATLVGVYFGWLLLATGNLLVPAIAHGVYDFLALVYLVKIRRHR